MILTGIQSDEVQHWWPRVWPLLKPAVELRGQMTADSVYKGLRDCDLQLWAVTNGDDLKAAVVTEIANWPGIRECVVLLTGGQDVDAWLHGARETIEAWAKEIGCQRIIIDGRLGWVRKFPDYQQVSIVLAKDLH